MKETDEKWLERIRLWKASGQTAEAFAVGQPFKASTLKWRAAELRRAAEGGSRYGKGHAGNGAIRLARVVSRARESAPGGCVVVEVSGARISLSRGFDAELLTDVVRALGAVR
jgi:AAA+ superfamily predicted ATPase